MAERFHYKVGILGCPQFPVSWTRENLQKLADMGFNTVQLNMAWGYRPGDEPLNLEDVVDMSEIDGQQPLPLFSSQEPARIRRRRNNLRKRIALCKQAGLRTIFHFGAPYNMHCKFGDNPPNCLLDPDVQKWHVSLVEAFASQYPGVDDLLVYTYDQDAWLCSEFGRCPRCRGIPLHDRVSGFVNLLAATWRRLNPGNKLWWEPWELSAGQVFKTIPLLCPSGVGLALHSNIAEVMAAMPVDRWLEIAVRMAKRAGLPVIVEHFLGGPTEEVEPFQHLSWPLVVLRSLKKIAALDVDGIKEYYGIVPVRSDANLRMTALFFSNPDIGGEEALRKLAEIYGPCADEIIRFWEAASEAMELFPWNASWFIREVGRCNPVHGLSAAFIRGQQAYTPSWESTRRAIFMKTDDEQPDPWMLEDIQLQCELAAERITEVLRLGESIVDRVPENLRADFTSALSEFLEWKRRTLSYVYHIRETNLTHILRECLKDRQPVPGRVLGELRAILEADIVNQGQSEALSAALALLGSDPGKFAQTWFLPDGAAEPFSQTWFQAGDVNANKTSPFSLTSR